ncbi:MAG TPA: hypothetical protein VGD19_04555 [Allosphingosinicella sp.]|jgi:hypothetical protein
MNRPILLVSALALAVPALAQNSTTTDDMSRPAPTEGMAAPDAQDRTSPSMAPAQTPTSTGTDSTTGSHGTMEHGTMDHGTMGHGSAASSTSTSTGTMDTMSSTGTTTGSSAGTMTGTSAATGVGGPDEARDYPVCSRTVTDSCVQTRNSPRPRR